MYIQVKISFKEDDVAIMRFLDEEMPELINVSNVDAVIEGVSDGYKGFHISPYYSRKMSTLDGTYNLYPSSGYPGIITKEISDADGVCDISVPFHLDGTSPQNLYLNFDSVAGEYAVDFTLTNSETFYTIDVTGNTSTSWIFDLTQLQLPATLSDVTFTLLITKWSRPHASIKITRLSPYYILVYTGRDLKSVVASENLLNAQMNITPGICEQYANITVYDRRGILRNFARLNQLSQDYIATISAVDDVNGDTYELGNYIIADWILESTSSTVGITCRDQSYRFEKIRIERSSVADRSLDDLLGEFFAEAKGVSWRYLDVETRARCEQIIVPNSWYLASDLYTMLNKLCALGMLRIYWYIDTFVVGRCC